MVRRRVAGFGLTLTARDVSALGAGRCGPGATSRRSAPGGRVSRPGPLTFAPTPTACPGREAECQLAQLPLSACSLPHPLTLVAGGHRGQPGSVSEPGLRYKALSPAWRYQEERWVNPGVELCLGALGSWGGLSQKKYSLSLMGSLCV